MQCRFCRAWNEADERRCVRCGRRLHLSAMRLAAEPYPISGANAPALDTYPEREPVSSISQQAQPLPENVSYQPPLFRDASGAPKVIPIPTLTPIRPREREEPAHPRRTSRPPSKPGPRRGSDAQQQLDFHTGAPLGMNVEAVIYCDAPVALPIHRLLAAAFDASMIMMAVGVFLAIFFVSGGVLAFTKQNIPFFVGVAALLAVLYRVLWCLANGDSPGMRFAGLRLVDFDGRSPDRDQRGMRQIAGLLSVVSAGLGLVWALVDEENLTWHDHISKTFPTAG